ncbi:hypothetical protein PF002_g12936 [Phytophthora fragariae]|uniref:Uncharacterized protein n=1 Tax=Phytophthora fragariae TaxID=53985 RepID=A0A6A3Z531_9STRA|nr:hypothetical protein PF003_g35015 [Phytophthora fragariae]KAE9230641.1 hypothetical protein PF002_g12936 [Phytophthora fragariae]KAE9253580.1 hypothetical protein PF004_g1452 [Phytophthora fragariae]KAE9274700.1 hypothetical protein PF008_g29526 [Phytophthora fragariae]KAE9328302.1 hypothetical protein PF001_g1490 [Phytophthora fragariae]
MHILNLCLQYAIGIRENKETVSVYDPKTGAKARNKRYYTVGGEFKKGRQLIKAVRDLNNHFSTDQRCKGLEGAQDFFSLPKLKTTVDCETRVAYTVKLFQHSIVNCSAFQGYFK